MACHGLQVQLMFQPAQLRSYLVAALAFVLGPFSCLTAPLDVVHVPGMHQAGAHFGAFAAQSGTPCPPPNWVLSASQQVVGSSEPLLASAGPVWPSPASLDSP